VRDESCCVREITRQLDSDPRSGSNRLESVRWTTNTDASFNRHSNRLHITAYLSRRISLNVIWIRSGYDTDAADLFKFLFRTKISSSNKKNLSSEGGVFVFLLDYVIERFFLFVCVVKSVF
jgi:hypothetical protein